MHCSRLTLYIETTPVTNKDPDFEIAYGVLVCAAPRHWKIPGNIEVDDLHNVVK